MDYGRGMKCEAVARVISDADRRITRRRDIRAHLRDCPDCRRFQDAIGRREGVLAGIPPIPATAAVGLLQALFGGSGGGGTVAALTGGVTKSAGFYGALKAAGTLAAVAVIGTAAIQSQMNGGPPNPSPHDALLQARDGSSRLPSSQRAMAVRSAHAANPSHRLAATDTQPSAPSLDVAGRRPRPSSFPVERGSSLAAPLSPADPPHQTAQGASHVADFAAEPTSGKGSDGLSKPEKKEKPESPGEAKTPPGQAKTPPGQVKAPPGQAKMPPGQAKTPPGQAKMPPGQAKKQGKAEEQTPSTALPSPAETEPPSGSAEATQPVESPSPNGKAKGHEK
jgi:hypothetical protein